MEVIMDMRSQQQLFYEYATDNLLSSVSPFKQLAIDTFDAYLYIRAPYNLSEENGINPVKRQLNAQASKDLNRVYNTRTADGSLRRSLCQYPTEAAAQYAGMSLDEYSEFVYKACKLDMASPAIGWRDLGRNQQQIVDYLNKANYVRYVNHKMDVSFRVEGRIWMNSDGRTNMPSGEVYTAPIENSVNGVAFFDYPSIFRGEEVSGVRLEIKEGQVVNWDAERGKKLLDELMVIPGARYFGEVAIGTNYNINRPTRNILFDEKIGGTIHMALGQSYHITGGKNDSPIHWDLIAGMQDGGKIYVDDTLIYQDGRFLVFDI